jgi:ATP-dependent helicase HrpB
MLSLPIDPLLPELCRTLQTTPNLVLGAPPGAGKTTRVPRALLDAGIPGEILVLEPRRIATRLAARRVAEELGEEVGRTVGYAIRFEDVSSESTRIRFVTEGVLTRRLLANRSLDGVGAVLLDEFHERHLQGDVALALLRRLQRGARPDLRLLVMSATLATAPLARFLGDAPVLMAEGRRYDVAIEHLERTSELRLEALVASSVRRLVAEGLDGDVLVFLPGGAEIQRAAEACRAIAAQHDLWVLPLHGSLTSAEQDRAVKPADRRKLILSTNVAETSVTIDGVVAVIDSGLARVASHAAWSGLPTLKLAKISRASATQRTGRAGRTQPGRCLRLYTRGDFLARPEHDTPEVARADLAATALELFASGVTDLSTFGWFEAPPAPALVAAEALLVSLGAVDESRELTPTGAAMARLPIHPRLARMMIEASRRGVGRDGSAMAAIASERDDRAEGSTPTRQRDERGRSDLLRRLDELDGARSPSIERVRAQLWRAMDRSRAPAPTSPRAHEDALLIATLAGYPDRVGRIRRPANATGRTGIEVVLASGGTAALADTSVVADAELIVAIDVEERSHGRSSKATVRLASEIEADWLLELFTDRIRDTTEPSWNEAAERVEVVRRLAYDGLILEETRVARPEPALATPVLAQAARAKGFRAFTTGDAIDKFLSRVAFARAHCPELELPALDEAAALRALDALCEGRWSFAELRAADLASTLRAELTPTQLRQLDDVAPERFALPGGRRLSIEYPGSAPPSAASRLQDFFGMSDGPKLARGRVALVLHLLAPNQRAVQITTDLAGFWAKHYPSIARELRRKYPRHAWPDHPQTAAPPAPRGR